MPARYIGAHMPTGKGLADAVRRGKAIGCTAVQVFTNSPQQWAAKEIKDESVQALATALDETGIGKHIVSHDSYLINLCAPNEETRSKSIAGAKAELARCAKLGIPFAVGHMGAHMGQGEEAGLKLIAEALVEVFADSDPSVTLLAETTAGQGSSIDYKFEHLASLIEALKGEPRFGVCMDTCHIFAAGYDIRSTESYGQTMQQFSDTVGFDRLKVVHCNDSKKPLGSRVDRHEHLGDGEIGPVAFQCLVNDPRMEEVLVIVETPEAETMHEHNVAKLWGWVY